VSWHHAACAEICTQHHHAPAHAPLPATLSRLSACHFSAIFAVELGVRFPLRAALMVYRSAFVRLWKSRRQASKISGASCHVKASRQLVKVAAHLFRGCCMAIAPSRIASEKALSAGWAASFLKRVTRNGWHLCASNAALAATHSAWYSGDEW